MHTPNEGPLDAPAAPDRAHMDLLAVLAHGLWLTVAVPLALDVVEQDPVATAGFFRGDVMRGLMEVPGPFWGRHPQLYARYRGVLRASVAARRNLPYEERMQFWLPLDLEALGEHVERAFSAASARSHELVLADARARRDGHGEQRAGHGRVYARGEEQGPQRDASTM
jgi:hypothetical protein